MLSIITFLYAHWVLSSLFLIFLLAYMAFELRVRYIGPRRVSPQEAIALMNQKGAVLLDIREKTKYDQGHILNAVRCAPAEVEETVKKLKVSENQPILLVCQLGQTTTAPGTRLKKLGFTEVYQLAGGISAWVAAELPLHK